MAERIISKRVEFEKGKQREFIQDVLGRFPMSDVMKLCGVSSRTIRDWRREKYMMDFRGLKVLCKELGFPFPKNVKVKERYWYASKGARLGWVAVVKKYGTMPKNEEYRKRKWLEWWELTGKYQKHPVIGIAKTIHEPSFSSKLAEFVGIVLGDGGISRNQVVISLHSIDDEEYMHFVVTLMHKIFKVPVSIFYSKKERVVDLIVSRTKLVKFCVEKLGLKIGNKVEQQVDIPLWIRQNKRFLIACIRGLIDTDGSVFIHRYRVNGKWYYYKKLAFSNRSEPLLLSVFRALQKFGMNPRMSKDGEDVRLESKKDLALYFSLIGTHNPKCLKKYES